VVTAHRASWAAGLLAAAALLLVALPLVRSRLEPEGGSEAPGALRWRGGEGNAPEEAGGLSLLIREPGIEEARIAQLEPVGAGHWRITAPAGASVQLYVAQPPDVAGETWEIEGALWRVPAEALAGSSGFWNRLFSHGGVNEQAGALLAPLRASGRATDPDIPLGGTVRLSSLPAQGFSPGDALRYRVDRGGRTLIVDVVLSPSPAGE
jgi:hypothetical protein